MKRQNYEWDIFIAHAGADKAVAKRLYDLLDNPRRVFLDSESIEFGQNWDQVIEEAQRKSLVTVVLVSSSTEAAYYQREEIAAAISMARADEARHRLIPVYLDDPKKLTNIPYGLRLKHAIQVTQTAGLLEVAENLRKLLAKLKKRRQQNAVSETKKSVWIIDVISSVQQVEDIFVGNYIVPSDCDEAIDTLKAVERKLKRLFTSAEYINSLLTPSKHKQLTQWRSIERRIQVVIANMQTYRDICLTESSETQRQKQKILREIQLLADDMRSVRFDE
jgi:hypothetical protein